MFKRALCALLFVSLVSAQNPNTAAYPGAIATDNTLLVASNNAISTLASSMTSSQTTVPLVTATNFVAPTVLTIGSELVYCPTLTGTTYSGCTRGWLGTVAAAYASGIYVYENMVAYYHNQVAAEIKAIETALGIDFSGGGVSSHGASYILLASDNSTLQIFNGSSLTATLPNPPPSNKWKAIVLNVNSSALTISGNGLAVTGLASLSQYQWAILWTDGSNYWQTSSGVGGGSGNMSAPNPSLKTAPSALTETWTVGAGGVTQNTLVIKDTSNPAKIIAATGSGAYGIAMSTAAASGSVEVARWGIATCIADNTISAGDLIIPGTSTVIDCRDSGQTSSANIPISTRIIGSAITSAAMGANFYLALSSDHFGTQVSPTTINAATCTPGSSCAPYGGANMYTSSHTVNGSGTLNGTDTGKLIVMNCSSACALTFESAPVLSDWWGVESIGTALATVSLNGKNWNAQGTAPVLNAYRDLRVSSDGSNYFGDAPLTNGANVNFTPSATGFLISSTGGGSSTLSIANAGTTGTTVSTLTKLTGAPSTAVIAAITDTGGVIGVTTSGAGTSGSATVQLSGPTSCVFDGATTAGDYVQISTTTAGNCHDAGSSYPTTGQIIGRVLSTNASAGTYSIDLFSGTQQATGGVTVTYPAIQANVVYCPSANGTTGYTCSFSGSQTLSVYSTGMVILINPDVTCSAACTVDIDGVGVVSIKQIDGATDPGGTLVAHQPHWLSYNGTVFLMIQ